MLLLLFVVVVFVRSANNFINISKCYLVGRLKNKILFRIEGVHTIVLLYCGGGEGDRSLTFRLDSEPSHKEL